MFWTTQSTDRMKSDVLYSTNHKYDFTLSVVRVVQNILPHTICGLCCPEHLTPPYLWFVCPEHLTSPYLWFVLSKTSDLTLPVVCVVRNIWLYPICAQIGWSQMFCTAQITNRVWSHMFWTAQTTDRVKSDVLDNTPAINQSNSRIRCNYIDNTHNNIACYL
jgi:hypothetical protein